MASASEVSTFTNVFAAKYINCKTSVSYLSQRLANFVPVSAIVLLLWDTLITVPKDLNLLRRNGWTKTQAAYMFNRLMSFIALFYFFSRGKYAYLL